MSEDATAGGAAAQDTSIGEQDGQPQLSAAVCDRCFEPFLSFDRIGLAVSGGSDSVALMLLASEWAARRQAAGQACPELVVLTVDHGLRPASGDEARQVCAWARDVGIPSETLVWTGPKPRKGLQDAAREARYRLLSGWARRAAGKRAAIAMAHHARDQAETVLMRLARGSGVDGLAAMRPVSDRDGIAVLRPLLDVGKQQITDLLLERGVAWIDDPSNESLAFERVRVRAVQASRQRLGLTDAALALTARRLARAVDALEDATANAISQSASSQPFIGLGGFALPTEPASLSEEILIRLLDRVLRVCGGTPLAGVAQAPGLGSVERLAASLAAPDFPGATLARCQLTWIRGRIVIHREAKRRALPTLRLEPGKGEIWDGRFRVQAFAHGASAPTNAESWVEVRAFDPPAERVVREALGPEALAAIPAPLRPGQPAFWSVNRGHDTLIAAPAFGFPGPAPLGAGLEWRCTAQFLDAGLATRR